MASTIPGLHTKRTFVWSVEGVRPVSSSEFSSKLPECLRIPCSSLACKML